MLTFLRIAARWFWNAVAVIVATSGWTASTSQPACTYGFSGGRLGDNLIAYLHAKWYSWTHQIPLLYRPFPYSQYFQLHGWEFRYGQPYGRNHLPDRWLQRGEEESVPRPGEVLFIPYFPDFPWEHANCTPDLPYFEVGWHHPQFRALVKRLLSPRIALHLPELPTTGLRIAVHWRKGTGVDPLSEADRVPLKLPPDRYYLEALSTVMECTGHGPCYVFLFTDHPCPTELITLLMESLPENARHRITWGHRAPEECVGGCVLEDLFHMARFDVLIRPCSNFSFIAGRIGSPLLEVAPEDALFEKGLWSITKVSWDFQEGVSWDTLSRSAAGL